MDGIQLGYDPSDVPQQTALATQLPTEILAEIFQCAILPDSTVFLTPEETGTDRHHFKTLRSVCRYWRAVTFSTQSLWTVAWIDFQGYEGAQMQDIINGLRHYFSYAGPNLLLTLGFKWGLVESGYPILPLLQTTGSGTFVVDVCALWLNFLFDFRARWIELSFFTTTPIFYKFENKLVADMKNDGPKWGVQFLQVSLCHLVLFSDTLPKDATTAFQDAFPHLETITLDLQKDTLITSSDTHLLTLHPTVIKLELSIHQACDPYLHKLTSGFTNLKKLILLFRSTHTLPADESGPPIDLPNLDFLLINFPPSFSLLPRLNTPKLTTLQFLNESLILSPFNTVRMQANLAQSFHYVVAFAQRCSETLRAFRVDTWFLVDAAADGMLRQLLEQLGSVEAMCIDSWFRDSPEAQAHLAPPLCLLPKLRRLCIHHRTDTEVPAVVDDHWDLEEGETAASPSNATAGQLAEEGPDTESGDGPLSPDVHDSPVPPTPSDAHSDAEDSGGTASATPDAATDTPFPIRGAFSWASLGAFVAASGQRLAEEDKEPDVLGAPGKFTFCVSGLARRLGGKDAQKTFEELENAPGTIMLTRNAEVEPEK